MASKCVSNHVRSQSWSASLSSLYHALQVYLQIPWTTASKCIYKLARSQPRSGSLSSLDQYFRAHLELISSTACSQSRYTVCRWVAIWIHGRQYKLNTWVLKIVERSVVAMISRRTSSVPKEDAFPRPVLPGLSSALPGAPMLVVSARRLVIGAPRLVVGAPRLVIGAPRIVVSALRLVVGAPRLVVGAPRCSQVQPMFFLALLGVLKRIPITTMVLLYQSSEMTVTLKAGRNALLGSETLLKLTHLSLHSTSSQSLLEASSD